MANNAVVHEQCVQLLDQDAMTATELTYDIPYNPPPRPPKPEACREPIVASFTVTHPVREGGFVDTEITVTRSCSHTYFASYEPVIGSRCNLPCLGPEVVTAESGRADKSVAPLRKGRGWKRLKGVA